MFLFKKKSSIHDELNTIIDKYQGAENNFLLKDVFAEAKSTLASIDEKDIRKTMQEDGMPAEQVALNMVLTIVMGKIESGRGIVRYGAYMPDGQARITLAHKLFDVMREKNYFSEEEYDNANAYLRDQLKNF